MADRVGSACVESCDWLQIESSRRREAELAKVKKDFELLTVQFESLEASLRKRHQEAMRDLQDQLDHANKAKAKYVSLFVCLSVCLCV